MEFARGINLRLDKKGQKTCRVHGHILADGFISPSSEEEDGLWSLLSALDPGPHEEAAGKIFTCLYAYTAFV